MDRISGLPKPILHEILEWLPTKDAARTSVLSKEWNETWYSFPILRIRSKYFVGEDNVSPTNSLGFSKLDIFIEYVRKRLLRLCDQHLAIETFNLSVKYLDHIKYMSHHVDLWLKMIIESDVQDLRLHLPEGHLEEEYVQDEWYDLPLCFIEAKSLMGLTLTGGIRVSQEFLNHSIKFSSVKKLSLCDVLFTHEGIIEHLISYCPLIEYLRVSDCSIYNSLSIDEDPTYHVKSIILNGLQKLNRVDVQGIQEVHIDAPNLENLCYRPSDPYMSYKLNLASFRNLKRLCLISVKSTTFEDKWFLELFVKFPFLEILELYHCSVSERINISSAQLNVLELSWCSNLKEVSIDAPNLLSCQYIGKGEPVISFLRTSDQLEVKVLIHNVDFGQFYSLSEFIQNIKPQRILASLVVFIYLTFSSEPNLEAMQVSPTPPNIKSLGLLDPASDDSPKLVLHPNLYFPFTNSLLSNFCPEIISFRLYSNFDGKAFIEFFYETLMGRRKEECFCRSSNTKCWWHGLKNVKIACSFMNDEKADLNTMFDALPKFFHEEYIVFILEL